MADTRRSVRIEVSGIVQGVGFRPFVHRVASKLGLDGHVSNDTTCVVVTASGPSTAIDDLVHAIENEGPPLARVDDVRVAATTDEAVAGDGFRIVASVRSTGTRTFVPPDAATCDDCLRELRDPTDRRFRHPFITCTNCGPRHTIIRDLPYDRARTTMDRFPMCGACRKEYDDPTSRRHHAQPIACHDCGPAMAFVDHESDRTAGGGTALRASIDALRRGAIVAVKGLGGFHLACGADHDEAVERLRLRKHRPEKPFAVMVADVGAAQGLVSLDAVEQAELTSTARPIVLARRSAPGRLSALVAPDNPTLGVLLPYTPVHHLLLDEVGPLVVTSANVAGEPIIHDDADAAARLPFLADATLTHDRPIHAPCDDSVVRVVADRVVPIRRARGYAPVPVPLGRGFRSVLAAGGELKHTCTVASPDQAWVSAHLGEMDSVRTIELFERTVERMLALHDVAPELVVVDAHPGYRTNQWANDGTRPVLEVQHHHAHVAAVMAEHGLDPHEPVLGFAFDGTGYGADATIWGGEVLIADVERAERIAHLSPVPLPGGDAAIRHPWRVALAHLRAAGGEWTADLAPVVAAGDALGSLRSQLAGDIHCVPTTSMGRLFDAIASVVGLRHHISFEAQAAVDLELAAATCPAGDERRYRFDVSDDVIEVGSVVGAIVDDVRAGHPVSTIAAGFHDAVAEVVARVAVAARSERGIDRVVLSGGVFQNGELVRRCLERLGTERFDVRTHRIVPPNDGGLSLGQAYIGVHRRRPSAHPPG